MRRDMRRRWLLDDVGATGVEYGLIIGLVAVVLVSAVAILGGRLSSGFTDATMSASASSPTTPAPTTPAPTPTGPAPDILRFGPSSGPTTGGAVITVEGRDFAPGASVRFGSWPAVITNREERWNGEIRLTVLAPSPSPAGAVDVLVSVSNPDGSQMTFTGQPYRYRAPFIATLSPSSGPAAGGTLVTISGYFFTPGASVTVDSVPASVVSQSSDANTIVVTTPPGSRIGAVSVRVANSDGVGGTKGFTYTP